MTVQQSVHEPHDFPGTIAGVIATGSKLKSPRGVPEPPSQNSDLRGSDSQARQIPHPSVRHRRRKVPLLLDFCADLSLDSGSQPVQVTFPQRRSNYAVYSCRAKGHGARVDEDWRSQAESAGTIPSFVTYQTRPFSITITFRLGPSETTRCRRNSSTLGSRHALGWSASQVATMFWPLC